jgi:tricorn protease
MKKITFILLTSLLTMQAFSIDDARMMRFPDINGNLITFVYALPR